MRRQQHMPHNNLMDADRCFAAAQHQQVMSSVRRDWLRKTLGGRRAKMQLRRQATGLEVMEHWHKYENDRCPNFRADIRDHLPTDILWYLCEVQEEDIERLFIISSDDWTDISKRSFQVVHVARRRTDLQSSNKDTKRIAQNIDDKIAYIESGGQLDTLLIAITDSPSLYGPFTLIEGNKRAVAFARQNTLAGSLFFVGYSPCVVDCVWTRHTYRQFLIGDAH